ncbi:MAG: DMT family transporter [Ruminococcaceae bacterium]|nr:DMT family transporter [Oscillospiraceae bacterium]
MKNQKLKGNMILLLTALVWGFSFISQSKGVEQISPLAFNGIRSLLGGLVLLPVIFLLDRGKKRKGIPIYKYDKTLLKAGIICGTLLCIASSLQTAGMVYTSPGKSAFITALYMVIIPIISLFTGKKPRLVIFVSVLIAVFGLYLMCIDESFSINKGDVLTFLCSFAFACHILVIDHYCPKVDGVKLACSQFFVCGIINLILMFFTDIPEIPKILNCWVSIGYSGIMSCGVAYTLQIVGQKYTDPTSASIIMSLESVFATLSTVILIALGYSLTGGALDAREISGCVLMFAAIILVQLPEKQKTEITA